MDNDSESFGAHLRRLRLARGLTQEEVAERAGLSARGVSDLERGINRRARADTFSRLAAALGLDSPEQANLDRLLRPPAVQRASSRTTVPVQLTSFVGRERELAEVSDLVLAKRLVTLTGAGGIGKTRLALIVAEAVGGQFDTVTMVELAALADGDLVAHSIAAALQIGERAGEPILTTLPAVVGATRLLILLDNCEHVLLSCARVAETLLRACPRVTLLATSREPLRVGPEVVWRVPPLAHRASDQAQTPTRTARRCNCSRSAPPRCGPTLF